MIHGSERIEHSAGKWEWVPPPREEITAVEYHGLAFFGSSLNEKGEPAFAVQWEIDACGQGAGGDINFSPPPPANETFFGERGAARSCERPITLFLEEGSSSQTTDSGSFSVAAIVITARWRAVQRPEEYGLESKTQPFKRKCVLGRPVNCATGNQTESQNDLAVGAAVRACI